MALPVKTELLKAIEAAINDIPEVREVIRNPSKPIDRETAKFPLVFIFDEAESWAERNRIVMASMPVHVEVWLREKVEQASNMADLLQAKIYQAITTDADVRFWSMRVRPDPDQTAAKFFVDEFLGGVILRYLADYSFKDGDPFAQAK